MIEKFISGDEVRCGVIEHEDGTLHVLPMFMYTGLNADGVRTTDFKYEFDDQGRPMKSSKSGEMIFL